MTNVKTISLVIVAIWKLKDTKILLHDPVKTRLLVIFLEVVLTSTLLT